MSWGPKAQKLVFEMFDDGQPVKVIVADVKKAHKCDDKTVRRCVAGLDLIRAGKTPQEDDHFERMGGTKRYFGDLERAYKARQRSPSTLGGAAPLDLVRQQPMVDHVNRLKNLVEQLRSCLYNPHLELQPYIGTGQPLLFGDHDWALMPEEWVELTTPDLGDEALWGGDISKVASTPQGKPILEAPR